MTVCLVIVVELADFFIRAKAVGHARNFGGCGVAEFLGGAG